jgi:TRAP-type mannitol/chloroaromatic compound transport system permease small subunit
LIKRTFILRGLIGLGDLAIAASRPTRWLALGMVGLTLSIVLLRYALGDGSVFIQESVMYMHGVLFMLAIPMGVADNTHVRVDIFYSRLSIAQKSLVNVVGHFLFLLPVAGFIFFISFDYVANSWQIAETSSEVGGIPGVFLLKTLIPLTAAALFIQGLAAIAEQSTLLFSTAKAT